MKLKLHLLTCNEPSPYTGRVYPLEEVKKMVEAYNSEPTNGGYGIVVGADEEYQADMPLVSISHTTDSLYIDNTSLMANVTLLDTSSGQFVKDNFEELRLSPAMTGIFDEDGIRNLFLLRTDFLIKTKPLNEEHTNEIQ